MESGHTGQGPKHSYRGPCIRSCKVTDHVNYNTQHGSKAQKRPAPFRVQCVAPMLDRSDEMLVSAAIELQHVVEVHLVLGEGAVVFELRQKLRAANVRLLRQTRVQALVGSGMQAWCA